jgi:UDP-galactopyranose mutase
MIMNRGHPLYDFLIVGAGLFGAVFAYEAVQRGKRCLVIDKREHIGGSVYCECIEGIQVHKYGPHIFRTNDRLIWEYVNQFAEFNRFTNAPIANYRGEIYNLPFNMNTFYRLWGIADPNEARKAIESQRGEIPSPKNLEEQAIALAGTDIYRVLIKEYTEKQWGRKATELPASIIRRIPIRFTFDNNYYQDRYQGIPIGGYNQIIEQMLAGCDVALDTDYMKERDIYRGKAVNLLFTGMIDEYYDFCYGPLAYRSLRFETEVLDMENFQGNAVVNYTSSDVPYTRVIEHKHFEFGAQKKTVITREYPQEWTPGDDPYYPVNDLKNTKKYRLYKALAEQERHVFFGGRLGSYQYLDMQEVIGLARQTAKELLNG